MKKVRTLCISLLKFQCINRYQEKTLSIKSRPPLCRQGNEKRGDWRCCTVLGHVFSDSSPHSRLFSRCSFFFLGCVTSFVIFFRLILGPAVFLYYLSFVSRHPLYLLNRNYDSQVLWGKNARFSRGGER